MPKLKPSWVITDMAKDTKIKLWRLMQDYHTYTSWAQGIARSKVFTDDEVRSLSMSKATYSRLRREITAMPLEEVETLPEDCRRWIFDLRPHLKAVGTKTEPEKPAVATQLRLENPQVATYTESPGLGLARYATIMVTAVGGQTVGCWAIVTVKEKRKTFPLHWAGLELTAEESTTPKIDILPAMPARLEIVFACPIPGTQAPGDAIRAGEVVMLWGTGEEKVASTKGCFIAQPLALNNPHTYLDAYLTPGLYHLELEVGCNNGQGAKMQLELTSPASWEGLTVKPMSES